MIPVLLALAALASCASPLSPPLSTQTSVGVEAIGQDKPLCATPSASLWTDFEGAPQMPCMIEGERSLTLLVGPEHAPPINPSPWYAFRYEAVGGPLQLTLRYLESKHRYSPKLIADRVQSLPTQISEDGRSAVMALPEGAGKVAGQELVGEDSNRALLDRLVRDSGAELVTLGTSHDGRPLQAATIGDREAPEIIVLLGRQHPPEVTGALAMAPFLETLFGQFALDPALRARYRILAVPMLNPDGVARGHWRANLGGQDLNRDWGAFAQPETRAVRDWLDTEAAPGRPTLMLDFHSTRTNLFYVQGVEDVVDKPAFVQRWLAGRQGEWPDYTFEIEEANANPNLGTAKNWFNETYLIPSITYEVGDNAHRPAVEHVARALASSLAEALISSGSEAP